MGTFVHYKICASTLFPVSQAVICLCRDLPSQSGSWEVVLCQNLLFVQVLSLHPPTPWVWGWSSFPALLRGSLQPSLGCSVCTALLTLPAGCSFRYQVMSCASLTQSLTNQCSSKWHRSTRFFRTVILSVLDLSEMSIPALCSCWIIHLSCRYQANPPVLLRGDNFLVGEEEGQTLIL